MAYPVPRNETDRLRALRFYKILETLQSALAHLRDVRQGKA